MSEVSVSDLKVGQTIRFYHDTPPTTAVGIIRGIGRSGNGLSVEVLSTNRSTWLGGHSCNGLMPERNGWWITRLQVIEVLCADSDTQFQIAEDSLMGVLNG